MRLSAALLVTSLLLAAPAPADTPGAEDEVFPLVEK
jgi:hypothetical protein